ncbi:hypothetical protein M427DRAFT_341478 [Gonapodya prolifera JEL478]|uniref:C2H2-type domain-containing protein n=1 Tax=Gonapodya prolifera (strain JEL478) TaxID=1344416 RepID=A0A139AC78_GONPJ|nr:hypothetical protein M427DRAFT_341478 [Gonapodya prolifera JEL478]|eukprot:KXS14416.1 hypothetical protein M427DRAFT_341478 [Gonapodya prolifera JEL478]
MGPDRRFTHSTPFLRISQSRTPRPHAQDTHSQRLLKRRTVFFATPPPLLYTRPPIHRSGSAPVPCRSRQTQTPTQPHRHNMAVAVSHLPHNPTTPPWMLAPPLDTITHPIVMDPDQGRHEPQYETATFAIKNSLGAFEGVDQNGNLVAREAVCEICGAAFARKFNLQAHMSIHAAEREKVSCEWCGRTFYRKGDLKRHAKLHELGHKQFVCEYCGKDFASDLRGLNAVKR